MTWKLTFNLNEKIHMPIYFSTLRDIEQQFPYLNKDRIYNYTHRNKNIWKRNKDLINSLTIEKI